MFKYLLLGGFARFMIEILRTNIKYYFELSGAQYISIIMMFIGAYQIWKRRYYHYYILLRNGVDLVKRLHH